MKRVLALVLVLLMSFGAWTLAEEENWYLETARELAQCVSDLSGDEGYLNMIGIQDNEYVRAFHEAGCEETKAAYQLTIPINTLMLMVKFTGLAPETDAGMELVKARLVGSLVTANNGSISEVALAAAAVLNFSRTYSMPESFETQIIALDYGEATVVVFFQQTGEDTITATAQPLFFRGENPLESLFETMKSAGISIDKDL